MDFQKSIPKIEGIIGYVFKDKSLLTQAFTRTSFCNEKNYRKRNDYESNEVLEFFGDAVLSAAIISIFLEKKTERYEHGIKSALAEGELSNLRSKLSDKSNLSKSTAALGLQSYLLMGEGDEKLGIRDEPSVMEDLFESIIGAVYIDCSMDMKTVISVVSRMLSTSSYFNAEAPALQSAKNALQEFCADKKRRLPPPVYKTVGESGPDHRKEYIRACYIGERKAGEGVGKNLKIADAEAARAALEILKKEENSTPVPDVSAPARLKELTSERKATSPEWRDLGESRSKDSSEPIFNIECRALGISEIGLGKSKTEARADAAQKILKKLKGAVAEEKKEPQKKKAATEKKKATTEKKKKSTENRREKPIKLEAKKAGTIAKSPSPKKKPHWHTKRS